jgi:hypothetical protein
MAPLRIGIVIILVLIWIGVAIWVASDAQKRGASATFWGLATFFSGPTGLAIYGLVREFKKSEEKTTQG